LKQPPDDSPGAGYCSKAFQDKAFGKTSFREDKVFGENFRAHCNKREPAPLLADAIRR
jgi:hypothetical protein